MLSKAKYLMKLKGFAANACERHQPVVSSIVFFHLFKAPVFDSLILSHHLSFVHYIVQSILSKLDILHAELIDFDILAFIETWLSQSTSTEDLHLDTYEKILPQTPMVVFWFISRIIYISEEDTIFNLGVLNVCGLRLKISQNISCSVFLQTTKFR